MRYSTDANGPALHLSKAELRAFLAFASTDDTRARLYGIGLHAKTRLVASTDGHRMLTWTAPEELVPASRVIPRAPLDDIAKRMRVHDELTLLIRDPGVIACFQGSEVIIAFADEQPPPVDYALPSYEADAPAGVPGLNARYLADFALVTKALGVTGVRLQAGEGLFDPVLVTFGGAGDDTSEWRAVLMPMHLGSAEVNPAKLRAATLAKALSQLDLAKFAEVQWLANKLLRSAG